MKKIVTVALALTMIMGTVLSVAAAEQPGLQKGDPTGATITKILQVPVGAAKPGEDFKFTFTAKGYASDEDGDLVANTTGMPLPGIAGVVTIPNSSIGAATPEGGYQIFKGSLDVFALPGTSPIINGDSFPHAGIFIYEVQEIPPSPVTAGMKYSQAKYEMYVYVTNTSETAPTGALQIKDVGFRILATDGAGIDPVGTTIVPNSSDPDTQGIATDAPKQDPIFTNRYAQPADLEISKAVTGNFADTTKMFTYTLKVTRPQAAADIDDTQSYVGTIYKMDGTPVTPGRTVTVSFTDNATEASVTFTLAHGEKVDFLPAPVGPAIVGVPNPGVQDGLPMGSTWELTETGAPRYWARVAYNNNGTTGSAAAPDEGDPLTINALTLGAGVNSAAWSNEHRDITPTGILMNNLPFILLIVVSIGGFVAYIANKRRKATN